MDFHGLVCIPVLCSLQRPHTLQQPHLLAVEFGLITITNNLQETGRLFCFKSPVKILQEHPFSRGKAEEDTKCWHMQYLMLYITPLVGLFRMDFSARASFDFPSLQTDALLEHAAEVVLVI